MTCESCGEKPKKCDKDFPKAVIEINNESIVLLRKVVVPVSLGDEETFPPKIGKYRNVILQYESNNHIYIYSSDGIPTLLETEVPQSVLDRISNLEEDVVDLENGLDELSQEFEDFKNSPDVVDIVATYADLQAYDTSTLGDNDIIRVLADETHNDASTYYRWNKTASQWVYIGASGPYYTKSETDALIDAAKTEWAGTETTNSDSGDIAEVTTTTGDFTWAVGNTVTVNFKYKALRGSLNIDGTGAYSVDNVRSLAGGIDSGVAIQYVCVMINDQRYYRPIGRLRASSDVAGPVFLADNLTTTSPLTALSANQGKVLNESITSVSGRVTTNADNISTLQTGKQDKLTAGTNIAITAQNVISATDTTYTAGNAITIDSTDNNRIDAAIYPADFFTGGPTVSGEGSAITLSNTLAAPMDSLELKGDTFQQTYTGKNLLRNTLANVTKNGVTATGNADGSVTLTGTSSSGTVTWFTLAPNTWVVPAGTYTLSGGAGDGSGVGIYNDSFGAVASSMTKTLPNGSSGDWSIRISPNTPTNLTVYPMLESGSTATAYEPYVGGTTSPNPDYPQDVQVVTGEQTVSVHGKNLFDGSLELGGIDIQTGVDSPSVDRVRTVGYISVQPNTVYTISGVLASRYAIFYNSSKTYLGYVLVDARDTKGTFTTSANTVYIRWYIIQPDTNVDEQLELGSTATSYEPYQSQDYTVNLASKNLWPDTPYLTGYVLLASDGSDFAFTGGEIYRQDNVIVGAKYTLTTTPSVNGNMRVIAYRANDTFISQIGVLALTANNRGSVTVTIPAETAYIKWSFVTGMVDSQLELGEQSTAYTPYYNYELAKIGDYQDYIYKSGDDWYVHKAIGKAVLDGNTSMTLNNDQGTTSTLLFTNIPLSGAKSMNRLDRNTLISDHFNTNNTWGSYVQGICTHFSSAMIRMPRSYLDTEDVAGMQAWLADNLTSVYYVNINETDTQITDSTLIAQLNALANAKMLDGQTNFAVSAVSPNLPAILDVSLLAKTLSGVLSLIGLKQDKLLAGANITISDNTISADSPTWTFTTTDPGEGGTLAPNNFIGVYE